MFREFLLRAARSYESFQRLIGSENVRTYFATKYIAARPFDKVLDIGCGTGNMIPFLPKVTYVGIDSDPRYIERAKALYPDKRFSFVCESISRATPLPACSIDVAIGFGILHHLDDEECTAVLRYAFDALKEGGRLVTLDGCYLETGQKLFAKILNRLDRGRFVRTQRRYMALAQSVFRKVEAFDHCGKLVVPVNHCVLICRKENFIAAEQLARSQ